MQEMKIPPTDPEYIKAHRLLSAVQQNQQFRKMQAQQRAQTSSDPQMDGNAVAPGINGSNGVSMSYVSEKLILI